jgi:hypothetical protein
MLRVQTHYKQESQQRQQAWEDYTLPISMSSMSSPEAGVAKFAALLGTKGGVKKDAVASSLSSSDPVAATARALMLCLSKSVESHDVICTLPSLDMRKVDEDAGNSPLPKVGEHLQTETTKPLTLGEETMVPHMDASVLSNAADASAKAAQVEQKAAQSLSSITSWTKSSLAYAPGAVSKNISDSFSSLVDSRVRAWTLLLLRHSLTTGDTVSRSRLLSMLSSIIKVDSAQTSFKTLPLPPSAMGQVKEVDVILPLLLEVDMQVSIQSKMETVKLRAPGTISGKKTCRVYGSCICVVALPHLFMFVSRSKRTLRRGGEMAIVTWVL